MATGIIYRVFTFFQQCCRRASHCSLFILTEVDKPVVLMHIKANTGVGVLPVKDGTRIYSDIRAVQNVNGVESFSLRNFPQLDNIEYVKKRVLTWFEGMRGIAYGHLDSYI